MLVDFPTSLSANILVRSIVFRSELPLTGARRSTGRRGRWSISVPPRKEPIWVAPQATAAFFTASCQLSSDWVEISARLSLHPGRSGRSVLIPRPANIRIVSTIIRLVRFISSNNGGIIRTLRENPFSPKLRQYSCRPPVSKVRWTGNVNR